MKKHNQQFSAVWGRMDTYICMTESLHRSPETITRLLTDYTPIQNVFGVLKKKNTMPLSHIT